MKIYKIHYNLVKRECEFCFDKKIPTEHPLPIYINIIMYINTGRNYIKTIYKTETNYLIRIIMLTFLKSMGLMPLPRI
jgi:hypothetical protein